MEITNLSQMFNGWYIGKFEPAAYRCDACEVAVKNYMAGQSESAHYHKVATEITLVLSGTVRMCGREFSSGDIIVLKPGEQTTFEALTDSINVVVKIPGALDDKYLVE
jgi:quercetin dioxygenase-like cupin family protein